ncbi:MAG: universal stress protein [Muribaculaceae bacterium]|nr:universal stress protein [Muribaculaceae bacterium]
MTTPTFITLCLHTRQHADILKQLLEAHGITVVLSPLTGVAEAGDVVRLRISPEQLTAALKVTESGAHESVAELERKMAGVSGSLLVPVDFSDSSILAVRIAFQLADRLSLMPVVLHAYTAPYFVDAPVAEDPMGTDDLGLDELELQAAHTMNDMAARQMHALRKKIDQLIKKGEIHSVDFRTIIEEGVPEDVILRYTRLSPPALVVMATRGRDRQHIDSMGSITAEVLDRCRVPLFTVPDNVGFNDIKEIKKLAFLCTMTRQDILSIETLMRMFDYPEVEMWLLAAEPGRSEAHTHTQLQAFVEYLRETYPGAVFHTVTPGTGEVRELTAGLVADKGVELIIVPNRKTNMLQRLFKPGMAHRIFFEGDVPLLVLPV